MTRQKHTRLTYTVLALVQRGDTQGEIEHETFDTFEEAVASVDGTAGDWMVRENRIVWLSTDLKSKLHKRSTGKL